MAEKNPTWAVLDDVYKSAEGGHLDKTNELSKFIAVFVTAQVLSEANGRTPPELHSDACMIITHINEHYPFDVATTLRLVKNGIANYFALTEGLQSYDRAVKFLSAITETTTVASQVAVDSDPKQKAWYVLSSRVNRDEQDKD